MEYLEIIIKLIISISVLNVWLLRADKSTQWRGGNAATLKDEFKSYGLSIGVMKAVGLVKIVLSLTILASIFYKPIENFGAIGMAVMMLAAIAMHMRIKDEIKRSIPAFTFLVLSILILII